MTTTTEAARVDRLARKAVRALPGRNAIAASRGDIADRAVAVGAVSAAGRQAFVALAEVNPEAALDAILAHTPASGPNTPATPVRAASRPAVAADTAAVDYPSGWGRAVTAAGRMARVVVRRPVEATADKTSLRQGQSGAAFQRALAASEAERVEAERAGHPGYDDRSVKPSATAAAQQAAYEADQARMRAEQVARYGA
jgi:hypothetical protein